MRQPVRGEAYPAKGRNSPEGFRTFWVSSPRFALLLFILWLSATAFFWTFAFASLPSHWELLKRVQVICFGRTPKGLPELYGWLQLTLTPLTFLILLFLGWGRELRLGIVQALSRPLGKGIAFLTLGALGLGIISIGKRVVFLKDTSLPPIPEHLPPDYPALSWRLPDLPYTESSGVEGDLKNLPGPAIFTFFYAHCATVCPLLIRSVLTAKKELRGEGIEVPALFITLDPYRDTLSRLKARALEWNPEGLPGVLFARADPEHLRRALAHLNYSLTRNETTGEVIHPPLIFIVDPKGRIRYILSQPQATWIREAIQRTIPSSSP